MSAAFAPRRRRLRTACIAVLAALPALVLACGACNEDRIAATYDHRVLEQAARAGDVVVYCRLDGSVDTGRVAAALRRVPGVRKGSVRIAAEPAAVSFAFDPALQTPASAVHALQGGLPAHNRLHVLKVVAASGSSR